VAGGQLRLLAEIDQITAVSEQLVGELVRPPSADQSGTCPRCATWNDQPEATECSNCTEVREALGSMALTIDPVSLYRKPSTLRDWLTQYKGRTDDTEPFVAAYISFVRALLGRFIIENGSRLGSLAGPVDCLTVVPSTHREPPHPLEAVLRSLPISCAVEDMLIRSTGTLGFRIPARDGYATTAVSPPGQRIVLVDDVYTTGARINSAAHALKKVGHEVVAAIVVGRRVNTGYADTAQDFWNEQARQPFSWTSRVDGRMQS